MEEIIINQEELEYFTNVPDTVAEEAPSFRPEMSFEEAAKDCITLDEFSKLWEDSIRRLIPHDTN